MKLSTLAVTLAITAIPAAVAHADFDIRPYLVNGKIITGGFDDATSQQETQAHAFGFTFQEDPLSPYVITDPGFNADVGALTPGTQLNFNVLTSLIYWNGTGSPSFAPAAQVVTLDLEKFTPPASLLDTTMTGTSGTQPGFSIGTVLSDGHIHQHLSSLLATTDSSTPPNGVYAFEMTLTLNSDATTTSDPFYIVYQNGVSDDTLDTALAYLDAQAAAPEPASLGVLGIGGMLLMQRRRNK